MMGPPLLERIPIARFPWLPGRAGGIEATGTVTPLEPERPWIVEARIACKTGLVERIETRENSETMQTASPK